MSSRPSQRASADAPWRPLRTPTSSRPSTANGPFKKIHQADLPVITTGSGHNIIDIKNSLINYCLFHDMSRISKIFTDGRYLNIPAPTLDPDRVGLAPTRELRDPHNLYIETFKENLKHHASEEISHNKSEEKLLGLLLSCTSKELEDKIKILFATQVSDRAEKVTRINLAGGTPEEIGAATNVLPTIDPADPLQTWANITYLVTIRASGNRAIDQDTATVSFANLRQRHRESLFDYASRAENVLLSFRLLELVPPTPATIAMRFIQGLDPSRYGIMQTTLANELHFGRDLYPTDLPTAISNASEYQTSPARNQDHASPHNIFAAIKTMPPPKGLRKDQDKGRSKATERIKFTHLQMIDPNASIVDTISSTVSNYMQHRPPQNLMVHLTRKRPPSLFTHLRSTTSTTKILNTYPRMWPASDIVHLLNLPQLSLPLQSLPYRLTLKFFWPKVPPASFRLTLSSTRARISALYLTPIYIRRLTAALQ